LKKETKIAVIGLGYVGLPLALAFSKHYKVVGYDVNETRVSSTQRGLDCYLDAVASIFDPYLAVNSCTNFISNPFDAKKKYDSIIVAVSHDEFIKYTDANFNHISQGKLVLLDLKGVCSKSTWKF
jgi:UDP-N-acetyl-D-mannosaminuronate dehydrogenase